MLNNAEQCRETARNQSCALSVTVLSPVVFSVSVSDLIPSIQSVCPQYIQYVHYLHCTLLYTKYTTACKLGKISVLLLMKKDPSLSCKASGRALLPRPLRTDIRMQLIALQLTNALKESTTGR